MTYRALTNSAGAPEAYADQLFTRVCRWWGLTRVAAKRSDWHRVGHIGRPTLTRATDTLIRAVVFAEFIRELDDYQPGTISVPAIAAIMNVSERTVRRYRQAIKLHLRVSQQFLADTMRKGDSDAVGHKEGPSEKFCQQQ